MENYNIPEKNSLDSMEGVGQLPKENTDEDPDRRENVIELKKLASQYKQFCFRYGNRMFSGTVNNLEELQQAEGDIDWSKGKYDDDEYFEEMLAHPAFTEKINSSDVVVDIGNGGNLALRIDADFLKRNGFKGKVIGVDPFQNEDEINTSLGVHTEAIKKDGLSYLLEQADKSQNVLCSNLEYEIIDNKQYAKALVEEIFRVLPDDGVFICIHSNALDGIASKLFPYEYFINDDASTYLFTKKPVNKLDQAQ